MVKWYMRWLIGVILLFPELPGTAQSMDKAPEANLQSSSRVASSVLDVGPVYHYGTSRIQGIPYLDSMEWTDGTVFIYGRRFENLELNYDIYQDILIRVNRTDRVGAVPVELNKSQVDSFYLSSAKFINLKPEKAASMQLKPGYYHLIESGSYMALGKYTKLIDDKIENRRQVEFFVSDFRYYICERNQCKRITKNRDIIKYFKPYKKELKTLIKANNRRLSERVTGDILGLSVRTVNKGIK